MNELGQVFGLDLPASTELHTDDNLTIMCPYGKDYVEDGRGIHWKDAYRLWKLSSDKAIIPSTIDVGVESYYVTNSGTVKKSITTGLSDSDFQTHFIQVRVLP
jgi:hypothetical protein